MAEIPGPERQGRLVPRRAEPSVDRIMARGEKKTRAIEMDIETKKERKKEKKRKIQKQRKFSLSFCSSLNTYITTLFITPQIYYTCIVF
jgi:hypothetical protein